MAKLDLELYEADPEVEIDIKAAMEGLRNEALILRNFLMHSSSLTAVFPLEALILSFISLF
jgi:hypothetical protein